MMSKELSLLAATDRLSCQACGRVARSPDVCRRQHSFRGVLPVLFFFIFVFSIASAAEIDRLLVSVNGHVITEGDLELARNLNTIIAYEKSSKPGSREDEIGRLIDLELMRQELKSFSMTQEDQNKIQARLRSLRDAYAEKGGLPFFLKRLGLQESELVSYLQLESSMLRFVDFRFRPFANISAEEIKSYYEKRLTPQLQKAKLDLPPLEQVANRIEEILKEEKVNSLLDQWIKEIRKNSRIEYFEGARDSGAPVESPKP
jgi:hypothetical protein